jgi:hypothetical protein
MPPEVALLNPKFPYFMVGVIFLTAALVSTCTGKTIARYSGWVYRAKKPSEFWGVITIYYLAATVCFGIYLYEVYKFSN